MINLIVLGVSQQYTPASSGGPIATGTIDSTMPDTGTWVLCATYVGDDPQAGDTLLCPDAEEGYKGPYDITGVFFDEGVSNLWILYLDTTPHTGEIFGSFEVYRA